MEGFLQFLQSLAAAGITNTGRIAARDELRDAGSQTLDTAQGMAGNVADNIQFQPFGVTSTLGQGATVDAAGGGTLQTGADGLSQALLGGSDIAFADAISSIGDKYGIAKNEFAIGDITGRASDAYNGFVQNNGLGDANSILSAISGLSGGQGRENDLMSILAGTDTSRQAEILGAYRGQYDPNRGTNAAGFLTDYNQGGRENQLINMIRGDGIAGREADIFGRMEAAQNPERDRQRLALEERLQAQGRSGVRTAQYGGTPEQLAMAKAIEESRMNNMVSASQQALQEQGLRGQQVGMGLDAARMDAGLIGQLRGQGLQLGLNQQGQRDDSLLRAFGTTDNRYALDAQTKQAAIESAIRERLGLGQLGLGAFETGIRQQGMLGNLGLGMFDSYLREGIAGRDSNVAATNAALAQQAQSANIGTTFLNNAYTPQREAMGLLGAFAPLSDISNTNLRAGQQYGTNLNMTGLEALMNAYDSAAKADAGYLGAMSGAASNALGTGNIAGAFSEGNFIEGATGFIQDLLANLDK